MLRFPNPGSTIANFLAVYNAAHNHLSHQVVSLDDLVAAVVAANLATSSGHIGNEAIARSTCADRSRDRLYNQLKMYAELFRSMGWLHPTNERSLNFTFTPLGDYIVAAETAWQPLFQESVLGIVYPNGVLDIKGLYDQRPFAFILRLMRRLQNVMSRDEMIVGPLSATSDRSVTDVQSVVDHLLHLRTAPDGLPKALDTLSTTRKIQINTLRNYTRWPIAVLRDSGWAESSKAVFPNGHTYNVLRLTPTGEAVADTVESCADIRLSHLKSLSKEEKNALSVSAHYAMLERSGFDITPVRSLLDDQRPALESAFQKFPLVPESRLLYSPFQTLSAAEISEIFPSTQRSQKSALGSTSQRSVDHQSRSHLFIEPAFIPTPLLSPSLESVDVSSQLRHVALVHDSPLLAARAFAQAHISDTKSSFYPLVSHLFQILGYRSEVSRSGVNYQRWDACIWIGDYMIPIEIKSPTEERELSTKAIRQALENKIISLSRGGLSNGLETTSLIVGYSASSKRSEIASLIDDIYQTYGFRIGVVAIDSLAVLALRSLQKRETISSEQLAMLKGFINV